MAALAAPVGLASRHASACEPDALDAHLAAVCDGALSLARTALEAALRRALAVTGDACSRGDPVQGARFAATRSRMAGRIEGRSGGDPLDLAAAG